MKERKRDAAGMGSMVQWGLALTFTVTCTGVLHGQRLPDAPSAMLGYALQNPTPATPQTPQLPPYIAAPETQPAVVVNKLPPCAAVIRGAVLGIPWSLQSPESQNPPGTRCRTENQLQPILSGDTYQPLTPQLKGYLAIRNITDPFTLITIGVFSGLTIAADSHTAYGPGYKGWGKLAGYTLVEDMTSEFFGTFAIPSLVHEDPRYHRMRGKPIPQRLGHALVHTIVSQHDDGRRMPNYATLLTYPICAELSNLYVPGLRTNARSTGTRIVAGYATDPIGPLLAEFLPDVAKHIHIRVVFVQEILQRVANGPQSTTLF